MARKITSLSYFHNVEVLHAYAECVKHIMVLMLNGFDAKTPAEFFANGTEVVVTQSQVDRAQFVIENAFFVGIHEKFECSVRALHAKLGNPNEIDPLQLNPARTSANKAAQLFALGKLEEAKYSDIYDDPIYEMGLSRLKCPGHHNHTLHHLGNI
jgi:hypothetical protein